MDVVRASSFEARGVQVVVGGVVRRLEVLRRAIVMWILAVYCCALRLTLKLEMKKGHRKLQVVKT